MNIDPVKQRAGRLGGLARAAKHRAEGPPRPILEYAVTWKRADELREYWRNVQWTVEQPFSVDDKRVLCFALYDVAFRGNSR